MVIGPQRATHATVETVENSDPQHLREISGAKYKHHAQQLREGYLGGMRHRVTGRAHCAHRIAILSGRKVAHNQRR